MPETRYDNRSARPPLVWRWPAARRRRRIGPLAHPRFLFALFVVAAVIALLIAAGTARALGL